MPLLDLLPYFFLIILVAVFSVRIVTAFTNRRYMNSKVNEDQKEEYRSTRNQSITLSAFTLAAIALVFSNESISQSPNLELGIAFLSVAMFSFFIGSYMFMFMNKRHWFPYIGETLEFVGILALAMGLFNIITGLFQESLLLQVIYFVFFAVLLAVAVYELLLTRRELNVNRDRGRGGGKREEEAGNKEEK
jgi:hypothetical protein